jgi:hypothetical protein
MFLGAELEVVRCWKYRIRDTANEIVDFLEALHATIDYNLKLKTNKRIKAPFLFNEQQIILNRKLSSLIS